MTASTNAYRIDPLVGEENWGIWNVQMLDILYDMGLANHVTSEKPVKSPDAKDSTPDTWDSDDRKALTAIRLRVDKAMFSYVMSAKTAKNAWDSLEGAFKLKGPIATIMFRRKLFRYTMEEGTDMEEQLRIMRGYQEQLAILGHAITDADFALTVLTALPDSWDSFISSINITSTDNLKSADIISRIQSEAARRKDRSGSSTAFPAHHSHGKFKGKPSGKSKFRHGVFCHDCGKEGHIRPECKSSDKNTNTNKVHVAEEEDSEVEYEFSMAEEDCQTFAVGGSTWLGDSGAQSHVVIDRSLFSTYTETPGKFIEGVGRLQALGRGTVPVSFTVGKQEVNVILKDVIHAPGLPYNLISLGRLTDSGLTFQGGADLKIFDGKKLIAVGKKSGRLYRMDVTQRVAMAFPSHSRRSWYDWHCTLGHLNMMQLRQLKSFVNGMDVDESSPSDFECEPCTRAKHTRRPYPKESSTKYAIGELTVIDTWGPARTRSLKGNTYFLGMTDVGARWSMTLGMKNRTAALDHFSRYKALVENQHDTTIKRVRADNAKEFIEGDFKSFLDKNGIFLETTAPYSSSQNGIAERLNRTLVEHARAMLIAHNLPKTLWEEALMYACYLKNRSPTRALNGMTPHEAFWGKRPDVSDLQEFGIDCWVLRPEQQQNKIEAKSDRHVFVGISENGRAYRCYNPHTHQVITSRNVIFKKRRDPSTVPYMEPSAVPSQLEGEKESTLSTDKLQDVLPNTEPLPSPMSTSKSQPRSSARLADQTRLDYKKIANPQARKPAHDEAELANISFVFLGEDGQLTDEPRTLAEVQKRSDWPKWEEAMKKEMDQLQRLGTYELQNLPTGRKAIGCRWVFLIKRDTDGSILKYKARLVAQGFSQIPGQDFMATFAPVMRLETFRSLLAFAAVNDYEVHQMDVVGAYLNGELEEEIYMVQPPGFEDGSGRVCHLIKALYGLKQAGRVWNTKLNKTFCEDLGFTRLNADICLYVRRDGPNFIFIAIHVDDMAIVAKGLPATQKTKHEISNTDFEVSDLGELRRFVGLEVERNRDQRTITIKQSRYIQTVLERFNMQDSHPVHTPLDPNVKLTLTPSDQDPLTDIPYATAIGSLMYAAVATRPDISFAVQTLSQFTSRPSQAHWTAIKRVLHYLKGTQALGITYGLIPDTTILGFSDADWGADIVDRRSVSGYIYTTAGGAISWSSKKQPTVALSSMEAEYMALTHATKEALWLRTLATDLGFNITGPMSIQTDNQSAIAFAHNDQFHPRSKHIDIRHHFVRERIISNEIQVTHCASEDNSADLLTKALARPSHEAQLARIGLSAR